MWDIRKTSGDVSDSRLTDMQNPRTRLLSLRMTEEEYGLLRTGADEQGARSVSDFARTALLINLREQNTCGWCCQKLSSIDQSILRIENRLASFLPEPLQHSPTHSQTTT